MPRNDLKDLLGKIKPISDAEAEQADFVVCVPASTPAVFDDDLFGHCCRCGVKVRYRWHAPRKPKRICMVCVVKQMISEKK